MDRGIRHHTVLCCISASGDAFTSLLIASHENATVIFEKGIHEYIDANLEIRLVAYVDLVLVNKDIREVSLPAVVVNRQRPGCANKPAIRLCDNCAAHCSQQT
jgi:hypothetical protein